MIEQNNWVSLSLRTLVFKLKQSKILMQTTRRCVAQIWRQKLCFKLNGGKWHTRATKLGKHIHFQSLTCIILLEFHKNRFGWVLIPDCATLSIKYKFVKPPGWYSIYFGWGCAAGFAKVLPFTKPNFANFVTPYQTKNAHLFLISIFCEQSC